MRVRINISGCLFVVCPTAFYQDKEGYICVVFSDFSTYGAGALKSIRSTISTSPENFNAISYQLLANGSFDLGNVPFDYTR